MSEYREHRKKIRSEIRSKRQELDQIKSKLSDATERAERREHRERKQIAEQELSRLKSELRAVKEQSEGTPDDF